MKTFRFISIFLTSFALLVSCEDFLDKSPDMGLDENDIYRDFSTMRGFMDKAYDYLENFHSFESYYNSRTYLDAISDELASICNFSRAIPVNSGNWLSNEITMMEIGVNSNGGSTTIWKSYRGLRIVNRVISDIDKVMNLSESERSQLLGQAYFLRAWFYFQLITRYGGMPKFDKLFVGDGDEDLPRMTYHQSHEWMMSDIENAILMLPDTWNDANTGRPTRIAALALKAKAQLYDASPLMQNGLDKTEVMPYDKERAKIAAKSADYLIQYLESHPELGYGLLPKEKYSNNFYWNAPPYTQPEFLWYNRKNFAQPANYIRALWLPGEYAKGTGNVAVVYNAPTQNMVDMYEKKDPHAGLELSAVMLNISGEHNQKLKEACRTLREYSIYTDKVRKYVGELELADAVDRAIRECIAEGVLKDFLEKHRAEAKEMSIFEYDQEKHIRQEREEAWADGHSAGVEEARLSMIIQMLRNGISEEDISRIAGASEKEIKDAKSIS